MPAFTRLEIAERQLERALQLYLDERDPLSAITLASAAEAILQRLLDTAASPPGAEAAGERAVHFTRRWRRYFRQRSLIRIAEAVRTGLQHFPEEDAAFEPDDVARDVLERAIVKYEALTGKLSPRMRRFGALLLEEAARPVAVRGPAD